LIDKSSVNSFTEHIVDEITRYGDRDDFGDALITSLFFGGGTASLMPRSTMIASIDVVRNLTGQQRINEVTLECEPGTISRAALEELRGAGVNRVGVCAQSFDDDELKRLTRRHGRAESLRLIDDALATGISNLHVDLMYGLQGQSLEDWRRTVDFTVKLPIKHISAYKLYVFKYGALDRARVLRRPVEEEDPVTRALGEMYDLAVRIFEDHGFRQYTLTEFAQPGYECDYLQNTFGGGDILPLGPSSFGRRGPTVWKNPSYVKLYPDAATWDAQRTGFVMDSAEEFKRNITLGLWLLSVDVADAARTLGIHPSDTLKGLIDDLVADGLVSADTQGKVWLKPQQRFMVGEAMRRLADLPSSEWIVSEKDAVAMASVGGDFDGVLFSSEIKSILRILRNDPKFFDEMLHSPEETVTRLGGRLRPEERTALVAAVRGGHIARSPLELVLHATWSAVINEHRRSPSRRVTQEN